MDGGRLECPERLGCDQIKLMSSEKSSERKAISTSSVDSVTRTAIPSKVKVFDCNICEKMVLCVVHLSTSPNAFVQPRCYFGLYFFWCPPQRSEEQAVLLNAVRICNSCGSGPRACFGFESVKIDVNALVRIVKEKVMSWLRGNIIHGTTDLDVP